MTRSKTVEETEALGPVCRELRGLGKRKPHQEARARLNAALTSKWESVRLVAARALAEWGDEESIMAIRGLLEDLVTMPRHSTPTLQVTGLLEHRLRRADFEWVVDLFLHQAHPDNRQFLDGLFRQFPPSMVRRRFEMELEKAEGNERLTHHIKIVIMQTKF